MKTVAPDNTKVLLVSVVTPDLDKTQAEDSLAELERLVTTLGLQVVAKTYQRRSSTHGGTVVGQGKLAEIAKRTGGRGFVEHAAFAKKSKAAEKFGKSAGSDEDADFNSDHEDDHGKELSGEHDGEVNGEAEASTLDGGDFPSDGASTEKVDVVVFDCDLSPSQLRNLENALGAEVMDRTGVIIEIFSRHAKTRAARLQVEIARLNYLAPRLRESGQASERQAGRGSGEGELELDRRKIRDRLTELKAELASVQSEQQSRRSNRSEQLCVALVGYTNAGKSSLMRALTGSEVLVEDKLFATLDTTVRAMHPETSPRILVSDTVGFIKKLPHDLVASFKSTLDEALNASLLLYLADASDPTFYSQLETTREVLQEVGVEDTPSLLVLNKADRLSSDEALRLQREFPLAIVISTRRPEDIAKLRKKIQSIFEKDMVDEELFAPYAVPGLVGEVRAKTRVLSEDFENDGVRYKVRARPEDLNKLKKSFKL